VGLEEAIKPFSCVFFYVSESALRIFNETISDATNKTESQTLLHFGFPVQVAGIFQQRAAMIECL
jgi:hypothetical protein